jgi:predicted transposase/invertase (TIGR01784 family)
LIKPNAYAILSAERSGDPMTTTTEPATNSATGNRQYKSSVFASYFSETKTRLVELYNAFANTEYPLDTPLEINTIDNALFYGLVNDVSFILNGMLIVLIEHQSSWNPNMPFRIFLYIAEVLRRIYHDPKPFYSPNLVRINNVRCFVLYNGREDRPNVTWLKLSDAFKEVTDEIVDPDQDAQLELKVPVYNISAGKNQEILAKSKSLNDYALFIAKVNEYKTTEMDLTEAIKKAIDYCIDNNIMADYLARNESEVRSVLFSDISIEDIVEVRAEAKAEARLEARTEAVGKVKYNEGKAEGKVEERAGMIKNMIMNNLPDDIIAAVSNLTTTEVRRLREQTFA